MLWNCFCVGAGGFVGAVFRYLLGFLPLSEKTQFPVITLGINVLGAFAIGVISQAAVRYGISDSRWILFLKTGVCGGFTTFSTFALESSDLVEAGRCGMSAAYMVLSVILCLGAVFAGKMIVRG